MPVCPHCQTPIQPHSRFCPTCGLELASVSGALTGQLASGTRLHGRYRLRRKIAQTEMSAVYQATDDRQPGTLWAVKEMNDAGLNPAERAQALADFQREANLLLNLQSTASSAVDHLHLPQILDLFEEGGRHYLVMAFIEGETLEERLKRTRHRLPVADVLRWAEQLCDVLAYLHSQRPPIIYRDLKPANVMIDRQGNVQLIDFGIARFYKPGQSGDTTKLGTEAYASPEHWLGQTEARSDLYTLGMTLYELLTKCLPPTVPERHQSGDPLPPPSHFNANIPPHVDAAILRALALRPDDRFGDHSAMIEMKAALQGQSVAQPRTKTCPHCGKPNLAASRACFACGYDFSTGQAPAPQAGPPGAAPASTARLGPYTLSTGHIAATPADLPAVCDADWERAVDHFAKGYIARWLRDGVNRLRAEHQHGPADDLEEITDRAETIVQRIQGGDTITRNAGLEEFLESLGAAPPVLAVTPQVLDLGAVGVGETGKPVTLTLTNRGRGYLSGKVESQVSWLKATPDRFGNAAGQSCTLTVTPDLSGLSVGQAHSAAGLQVRSNGGQATLDVQLRVHLPPVLEPEMVRIPAGKFLMGSKARDKEAYDSEKPQRRIHLAEYRIGKYPVTNAQFAAFGQTGYNKRRFWTKAGWQWKKEKKRTGPQRYGGPSDRPDHPVVGVSWYEAVAYCRWLAEMTSQPYRLPTEAEWEKTARGSDGRKYPWGNRWDSRKCNSSEGGKGGTTPVGTYSPAGDSSYGCADMAGNIWEWCLTKWQGGYKDYKNDNNQEGTALRVLRGGAFNFNERSVRCAYRIRHYPGRWRDGGGFRVVVAPGSR